MTITATPISSSDRLDDVEHHFRVIAGPGAGKTYWLTNHVRHVSRTSTRLTPAARIGVISYTNVAVREILRGLNSVADRTDISTIHSFLFRNLVRPYLHLLKDSDGSDLVAHARVGTHSEHFINRKHLDDWLSENNSRQLLIAARKNSFDLLIDRLRMLSVRIDSTGDVYFAPVKSEARDKGIQHLLTVEKLLSYKRKYWLQGVVDHEDVLYFGYRLLHDFPILRRFLSARFPYLFIDEFQDTLPVQGALVRWLAEEGTVVGVIGDPEQAIYGFLDASASHFHEFELAEHRTYKIDGNRRSTESLVSFLNRVRTDGLEQQSKREELGVPPTVFSGNLADALKHVRADSPHGSRMLVLARNHKGVLRARRPDGSLASDPWKSISDADPKRCQFLRHLAEAVDLSQRAFFDIAMQRLVRGISSRSKFRDPLQFNGEVTLVNRRSLALSLVEFMMTRHDEFAATTTLDVYRAIEEHVPQFLEAMKLQSVRSNSKFHTAATSCQYDDLVSSLATSEETRLTRTIHQAKGSEAHAVFVVLDDDAADHILSPTAGDEEHRITSVALSRARDELYIFCPDGNRLSEFETLGAASQNIGTAPHKATKTRRAAPKRKRR